ncbi:O-antigen ligase family protein [Nonlabens ulvanivorans]|uniref:O-antigen ligase family protein n=1 Tax=Nonlabens ulvanivorans TaxID=906888 RepID=UPI002942EDAD|nr:O-antigen ligase family protein [Nonlabens ulvanivorans]WOI22395.1 O-antigen ligase family protein [Nonlabens ulvanivorans]
MIKAFLSKFETLEERLLSFLMLAIGLFPLFPNKLKPLPVVLLVLLTIWVAFKKKPKSVEKKKIWQPIVLSSLIVIYAISLLYTQDLKTGFKRLETGASLFLVPWLFYFLGSRIKLSRAHLKIVFHTYFWAAVLYAVIIIIFFMSIGYYSGEHNLEYCLSWLDGMLWGLSQHAIYASMILGIALLITPFIFKDYKGWKKVLIAIGFLMLIYMLFLMFRKGVVAAIIIAAFTYFLTNFKKIKKVSVLLITSVVLIAGIFMKDKISERVTEVFRKETYSQVDIEKSTSMRFAIYNCVVDDIKKSPWIGHGIGDGYELIENCLRDKHGIIFQDSKLRKNAHNQYLGIWLYTGLAGLLLFVFQLFLYYKKAITDKNVLFIQLLVFFSIVLLTENILDRATGVLLFALFLNMFFFMKLKAENKILQND